MRWAVAGCGDVVRRRVLPALREAGEETAYVWGRDAARAARTAEEYGVPAGGDDPGRLTAADAVYVATPVALHVPLALRALRAGCHVLVEKPLAGGLGGGGVLAAEAAGAGLCVGVAYHRRLGPAAQQLREALTACAPARVQITFCAPFDPAPEHPDFWRTDPAVAGGGVLADAGSHRLDLLLSVLGPPVRVGARFGRRFAAGAERRAHLSLGWASGTSAECRFAWVGGTERDRVDVAAGGRFLTLDPLDAGLAPNPHVPLIADFVAAVREGRAPACPVTDAVLVDDVITAASWAARFRNE
ncbi:Gfo/Idh/MocA family protein [Streptomyces hiroshimensis]|uniref:NADH-dependent dehydrogenase n=1 Tax=Streptomyces hiroshimensis TaxID=66424 RepID=A0ABQ2YRA5_9ACTN|nr:Gfo/Idh/MocA family oxidoreductase [Streptomyces hiroshimensis]GGX91017.1 NADH-dependent dehydrogenase [Streptomyces hiroshimensis]